MEKQASDHILSLLEYIESDEIYNNYLEEGKTDNLSDFDLFCIEHCEDIEVVLDVLTAVVMEVKEERDKNSALVEAMGMLKHKKNTDKAKYRRKAKNYRDRINSVVKDIDRQIESCTAEAEGTVNNEYCWMAINYLKKVRAELLGKDK